MRDRAVFLGGRKVRPFARQAIAELDDALGEFDRRKVVVFALERSFESG